MSRATIVVASVVATLSATALFFLLGATWWSEAQFRHSNALLYASVRQGLSEATVPPGGAVAPGTPIAVMSIPAIGLRDQVIVEGSDSQQTSRAVGHRRDTPLPGQVGVSLLYGRSFTYGGVFRHITDLRPGQRVEITTAQGAFVYEVERVRRAGDPTPSPLASDGSRVTMTTAAGAPFDTATTVSVDAKLVGAAVAGPGGRPRTVAAPERAMGSNTNSMTLLLLWLQALALAAVATTWAALRWGRWQAWLVGTPLLLGLLWETVQQVLLLLPNLV